MCMKKDSEKSKERFVKALQYSTPIVAGILFITLFHLEGNTVMRGFVVLLIVVEILAGVKAGYVHDAITPKEC